MQSGSFSQSMLTFQPDQAIKEWNEDEYIKNLRFISASWNKVIYQFAPPDSGIQIKPLYWVTNYVNNASFFFGKNTTYDYGFLTRDETNNTLPVPMFRGQDVYELIKHTVGVMDSFVRTIPNLLSVTALSEDAVSRKQMIYNLAKLQIENKVYFDLMKTLTGIGIEPVGNLNFQSQEQLDKYFESFQDALEKIYVTLAKYAFTFNHAPEFFNKAAEYFGIGGLVQMRCYVHNGRTKWRLVEPQNAIWDNYNSQNQHREDRFAGEYCEKTIPEILSMFDWTPAEREEIKALAVASNSIWQTYNIPTGNQLVWWRTSSAGIPMVTCVHGQWRSLKFGGLDDDGKEIWLPTLREGWLVGNKYVKDFGESKNIIEDKHDNTRMRMHYVTATADTVMGVHMGIVDRLREYQKLKDAFQTKLNQLVANSKGKRYVMYADKMPEGMGAPDVLAQLSQAGIAVLPTRDIDDDSPEGNRGLIDTIDMTLDPTILNLGALIANLRTYMDNILSLPAAARGQQVNYQSKDVYAANVQASGYGMSSYYNTFYTWVLRILELSADLNKMTMAEGDKDTLTILVGDAKVEMLKMDDVKEMSFEDFCLGLSLEDFMTDQERQALIQFYMQRASASADPEDEQVMVKLMQIKSKTEFNDYVESVITAKLARKQQEMMAQQQQQQMMAEQAANAQVQSTAINADNQQAMQDKQIQADMAMQQQKMQGEQMSEDPLGLR